MRERSQTSAFEPSGFFVWRTPLLPLDELLAWESDRPRARARMRELLAMPAVREAIFLASPDLESQVPLWLEQPESERGQKIERALVRYLIRMASRATPFGLFAGCSVGTLDRRTRLELAPQASYRRHTRLDMDYVCALTDAFCRDPALREQLAYRPNSSLYQAAGRLRYAEARLQGRLRSYHLVAVQRTDYLESTLARAAPGASLGDLARGLLEADPEISQEEAIAFLHELIDSQLLIPEIEPAVTGPEAVRELIAQIGRLPAAAGPARHLEQARAAMHALDAAGLGSEPGAYRAIAESLGDLPARVDLPRLFQVDMTKPAVTATLGSGLAQEIARGVQLLHRLARKPARTALDRFRQEFSARYEGREVPLVEALDEEIGIGYGTAGEVGADPSPLLEGLPFPTREEDSQPWNRRHTVLLRRLAEVLAGGGQELVLGEKDLEEMASEAPPPLPDAFAVLARVAAPSAEAVDRGEFRTLLSAVFGPPGARLFGRFCQADAELFRHVEEHLRAEQAFRPDALFAEIVHLPEGRVGNIIARPVLRDYEIPFLGRSGAPEEAQIPVTDLLVSVVGERIVLRSARLGRDVIPRLSTAHNFARHSLGIYRFLCELQSQGTVPGLAWDWGPLASSPFLPRVVHGRLVLARARWRIDRAELQRLGAAEGDPRFHAVQSWRAVRKLPRFIALADADNELVIDLANPMAVDCFVDLVKGRPEAYVVELFPAPGELVAEGPEGRFMHELVIPFVRTPEPARALPAPPAQVRPATPVPYASFPPGSEWLFAKLYTGTATADQVLSEALAPLVAGAFRSGAADRWFFIRYGDPDWHIRLRMHGGPERLWGQVLPALRTAVAPLMADGRVRRLDLDTYMPEVERYGGPEGLRLAERLFQADSQAVLALVQMLEGDAGTDARWRLAVHSIDRLLADLGFELTAKRAIIQQMRDAFSAEFGVDGSFRGVEGDRFRRERADLEACLAGGQAQGHWLSPGFEIFRRRSELLAPVALDLRAAEAAGRLTQPLLWLAPSYVHMHVNRLLRSAHRAHELVLYDFLARLYERRAATERGRAM